MDETADKQQQDGEVSQVDAPELSETLEASRTDAAVLNSGRPLSHGDVDQLGFREIADKLAAAILAQSASDGMVISIEGSWGSGKSSLVSLLADAIGNQPDAAETVRFDPWLVGERDALLTSLMAALASAVDAIVGETNLETAQDLGEQMRRYAVQLGRVGSPLAKLAGLAIPGLGALSDILKNMGEAAEAVGTWQSLEKMKGDLLHGLAKLPRRIVVIIDDLDRLEPKEAAEIMRLVRAVADFPNVVYLLCFDRRVLSKSLEVALEVSDGNSFLQKIVQVRFSIPRPEEFDLRRWFERECKALFASLGGEVDDKLSDALSKVCSREGGVRLDTPRDVNQVINALRLYWPPIKDEAFFPDLVWLQLIRLRNDHLYEWIERYMTVLSVMHDGAYASDEFREKLASELQEIIKEEGRITTEFVDELSEFIPGLRSWIETMDDFNGRSLLRIEDRPDLDNSRRLGSVRHYRNYFSFSRPSGTLKDQDYQAFVEAADQGADLTTSFKLLAEKSRPQGGTMAEVLVERLVGLDASRLTPTLAETILRLFGNELDVAAQAEGATFDWGRPGIWLTGRHALHHLLPKVAKRRREALIRDLFGNGRAIGWLTLVLRDQLFAHGRAGDRGPQQDRQVLSGSELDLAISLLTDRFRKADDELLEVPCFTNLLFGWLQSGDAEGLSVWVDDRQKSDTDLLRFLKACRSWQNVNGVNQYPLKLEELRSFMDTDAIRQKLSTIAKSPEANESNRQLAEELLAAIALAEDD